MKRNTEVLAMITVYREVGNPDAKVSVDGDMNYLGQGIAASIIGEPSFADTVIAAIDCYRLNRRMGYAELGKHIEDRVKILTNPGRTTAP